MTFICGEAEVPEELWSVDIPPVVAGVATAYSGVIIGRRVKARVILFEVLPVDDNEKRHRGTEARGTSAEEGGAIYITKLYRRKVLCG
jgi:hypothetical protein